MIKSLNPNNIGSLRPVLEKIAKLKAEKDALPELSPDVLGRIMQKFRLDWNFHSNSLEGNSLTYGETVAFLMEGLTAKGKPFKDHLDIRGHNNGIDFLMDIVKNRHTLTEADIRNLHKIILVEPYFNPAITPDGQQTKREIRLGEYKSAPNHVKTPTGEIHYYATPEETPARMHELMDWYRKSAEAELPSLVRAAVIHYNFVNIHPFDDGNGRMSRLLMNLILIQDGFPPLVVRKEERSQYIAALRQADAGDLPAFVEFLGENLTRSLEIYLRGAKGGDISEPDDLDKEIALLKASFKAEPILKELKSSPIIERVLKTSIFPLFSEIEKGCDKLRDMFMEIDIQVRANRYPSNKDFRLSETSLDSIEKYLSEDVNVPLENLALLSFYAEFRRFKFSRDAYTLGMGIGFNFADHSFSLNKGFILPELQLPEKLYHESISPEEILTIRDAFMGEIIKSIKERNGYTTS